MVRWQRKVTSGSFGMGWRAVMMEVWTAAACVRMKFGAEQQEGGLKANHNRSMGSGFGSGAVTMAAAVGVGAVCGMTPGGTATKASKRC
mmetsp:Transcript_38964/g.71992  ORF Transcript_38964/g.71992 Transcript_38964/m.71992 type:complete len:89 (+) Transcript_38964:561-827(+)